MLKQILKLETQSKINYLKALDTSKILVYVILAFIIMMVLLPMTWMLMSTFFINAEESLIPKALILLSLSVLIIHALFLVNGIIKEMFMDKNIESYLLLPIKPTHLFTAKMIIQYSFKVFPINLILAVIVGTALTIRYSHPVILINSLMYFVALGVLTIAVAYGLVFLVTKISSAKRVGEVLTLVGGFASVLPFLIMTIGGQYLIQIIEMMPEINFLYAGYLYKPSLIMTIVVNIALVLLITTLVRLTISSVTQAFINGNVNDNVNRYHGSVKTTVDHPIRSLIKKDLKLTFRDFKEWSVVLPQYLFPFIFLYLVAANPVMFGGVLNPDQVIIAIGFAGAVMISLFVSAMNTARDASHYQFLKLLPVNGLTLMRAKYIYNIVTILPVYVVLSIVIYFIITPTLAALMYTIILSILTVLTVIPIGMVIGLMSPVVSKKSPANRLDTASNVIITTTIFVLILAVGRISSLVFEVVDGNNVINHQAMFTLLISITVLCLVLAYFCIRKTAKKHDEGYKITYKD